MKHSFKKYISSVAWAWLVNEIVAEAMVAILQQSFAPSVAARDRRKQALEQQAAAQYAKLEAEFEGRKAYIRDRLRRDLQELEQDHQAQLDSFIKRTVTPKWFHRTHLQLVTKQQEEKANPPAETE